MKKLIAALTAFIAMGAVSILAQERFVDTAIQNRKAVLEEYTGVGCPNCPSRHRAANEILNANIGDFFIINIHSGRFADPNSYYGIDFRTDYGNALTSQAGINAYPSGTINRHVFSGGSAMASSSADDWEAWTEDIVSQESYANIAARATIDTLSRQVELTVQIYYTGNSPQSTNYLNVALLQDNILGYQQGAGANPDQVQGNLYLHMHALRDLLTGQWGEEITTTTQGSFVEKTYSYTVPDSIREIPVDMDDISFVAFLAEGRTEIVTACDAGLTYLEGGPELVYQFGKFQQLPQNTCDNNIRFSAKIAVRVAKEPISSIDLNFDHPEGRAKVSVSFEPALQAGDVAEITSEPIGFRANRSGTCWLDLAKINGSNDFPGTDPLQLSFVKNYIDIPTDEALLTLYQDLPRYNRDYEVFWSLTGLAGDTLAYGGPYDTLSSPRIDTLPLIDGCQQFSLQVANPNATSSQGEGYLQFDNAEGDSIIRYEGTYPESMVIMISHNLPDNPDPGPSDTTANEGFAQSLPIVLYPNPVSNSAFLELDMSQARHLGIRVLDNTGRCVLNLGERTLPAGRQTLELPAGNLTEGMYFILIQGEGIHAVRKMVVKR